MKAKRKWFVILAIPCVAAIAALHGCGGDDDGGGGLDNRVVAVGEISNFGSVTVNGIHFDAEEAAVTLNGAPGGVKDLRSGMIVVVRGTVDPSGNTGKADSVSFENELEGAVTDLSEFEVGRIEVMGQILLLDDLTVFRGAQARSLETGDILEASGYLGADGQIRARYVKRTRTWAEFKGENPATREIQVRGKVEDHAPGLMLFRIGNLVVQYDDEALEDEVVARGGLQDGMDVRVRCGDLPEDGVVVARRIEIAERARLGEENGLLVRLEGILTRLRSQGEFEVNGHRVRTTAQTRFENGDETDLVLDARVMVEGSLNSDGSLEATSVRWAEARNIKIEADVSASDAADSTLRVLGLAPGIETAVTDLTLLLDRRDGSAQITIEEFFAALVVGVRVGVRAYAEDLDGDGSDEVVAAKLELKEPKDWVRLQAPPDADAVDAVNRTIAILGVTVTTTVNTRYVAPDESEVDAEAFFGMLTQALSEGDRVVVKSTGIFVETGVEHIEATELELEPCHDYDHEYEHDYDYGGPMDSPYEFDYEHEHEYGGNGPM